MWATTLIGRANGADDQADGAELARCARALRTIAHGVAITGYVARALHPLVDEDDLAGNRCGRLCGQRVERGDLNDWRLDAFFGRADAAAERCRDQRLGRGADDA